MEKFKALGLSENVLSALQKKGWENPSPVQEQTIPLLLKDEKDVVGQAATGTGKTGAFGLPLIDKLDDTSNKVQALILCPTRELAVQVAEEIASFKGSKRLHVLAVYGGSSFSMQERALRKGVQIVVGTPGRIRDHIDRKTLKLDAVSHVVLDEADEMLNMGFEEEVREILKQVPEQRRMLLFSATMPQQILKIAKTFMGEYDMVTIQKEQVTTNLTDQIYFEVRDSDRFQALCRVIDTEPEFYGIVFCRTKAETDIVADKLIDRGYDAEAIHGDVTQNQRELTLKKFKMKKLVVLVATDVAARGIDVNDLTHVVNYNLPQDPEAYVHRIGRTGRAGKQGTAISIVSSREVRDLFFIQKIAKAKIRKESVPGVEDVIETKKMKLKTDLLQLLEKQSDADYMSLAQELMEDGREPQQIVAALLSHTYKDTLKASSYAEISEVASRSNQGAGGGSDSDKARLFVAKGHTSGMNGEKIIEFIVSETQINGDAIQDVRVYDNFSFITLPNSEAEIVLAIFNKQKKGGRSLVSKAKDKDGGGGNGGSRRNDGPRRDFKGGGRSFGERRSYGDRDNRENRDRRGGDRDRPARENRIDRSGERGERNERRNYDDRKPYSPAKPDFKREERRTERAEPSAEHKPKRRENKMTNYLDSNDSAVAPSTKKQVEKPSKKKNDGGEVDKFLKNYEDDLSW